MIHQDTQHGDSSHLIRKPVRFRKNKSNVGFNFPENETTNEINKMIILIALHPSIIRRHTCDYKSI
jgi:hypothetical protein